MKAIRRPKVEETPAMAEIENRVAITQSCKVFFHSVISIYSFMVFHGKSWVPWYLGGENDIKALVLDFPFTPLDKQVYYFMLIALGQPIQHLFEQVFRFRVWLETSWHF